MITISGPQMAIQEQRLSIQVEPERYSHMREGSSGCVPAVRKGSLMQVT